MNNIIIDNDYGINLDIKRKIEISISNGEFNNTFDYFSSPLPIMMIKDTVFKNYFKKDEILNSYCFVYTHIIRKHDDLWICFLLRSPSGKIFEIGVGFFANTLSSSSIR